MDQTTSAPSQAQTGLIKALQGLGEGFSGGMAEADKASRADALQRALESRAEAKDKRSSVPKNLYGPLFEKTTGLKLPADAPEMLNPNMGPALLGLMGGQYRTDNQKFAPKPTKDDHANDQNQAKLAAMGMKAAQQALGAKYKNGATPPLNKLSPEDAELVNNAFAVGAGPTYKGGQFVKSVSAPQEASLGNKLSLGIFGTPAAPAKSQVVAPGAPAQLDPAVADGIRKARAMGWNDDRIMAAAAAKGHPLTPADLAGVP